MERRAVLAPLLLAASLAAAAPAPEAESAIRRIENGVVVQVSPRPAAGSGRFAVYADFEVATPAGERLRMYVLWMGGSQYLPDVGAVCAIAYRNQPLARGNLHNPPARLGRPEGPLNVVQELSCGPPMHWPRSGADSSSTLLAAPLNAQPAPLPTEPRVMCGVTFDDRASERWATRRQVRFTPLERVLDGLDCGPVPEAPGPARLPRQLGIEQLSGPGLMGFFPLTQVVRVSPRPAVGSGFLMILTSFDVREPGGELLTMTMIYFGEDQFIPPVGSNCTIQATPGGIRMGSAIITSNQVDWLRCDTGSFSMRDPGEPNRIEHARIVSVSPPSARDAAYVGFDIEAPGRATRQLYLPSRGGAAAQLQVGAVCTLSFRLNWVTGRSLGTPRLEGAHVKVVDDLDCGPQAIAS